MIKTYIISLALLPLVTPSAKADLLGTAANNAVLAGSTATNTGSTTISGNLGLSPGTSVTGFPPGIVTPPGVIDISDAVALQAQKDDTTAYNTLAGLPFVTDLTGQDLGGLTLAPGVYHFDSSAQLTGVLTLNAEGSDNALWVFQIGSTLKTASSSVVQIINGGPGDGLFWQVGSSATLGTSTVFEGNILALTSITLNTNAIIPCGRALAQNGAVTMDTNVISTDCTAATANTGSTAWSPDQAAELGGSGGNLGSGLSNPADNSVSDYNTTVSSVPEPSAFLLLVTCIACFAMQRKWTKAKSHDHQS